jgi:hypothetical protein
MATPPPVLADAASPDPDRDGPDAPNHLPEWLVHLIALLIYSILKRILAARGIPMVPAWLSERPDLPPGSIQALAASIRGPFGNVIARMCRQLGIGPGHPQWLDMSRAIVAFGGSLKGFRAGAAALPVAWWENDAIVPGLGRAQTAAPTATALLLARQALANAAPPAPQAAQDRAAHGVSPALRRLVEARRGTAPPIRAGTGPPTGWDCAISYT